MTSRAEVLALLQEALDYIDHCDDIIDDGADLLKRGYKALAAQSVEQSQGDLPPFPNPGIMGGPDGNLAFFWPEQMRDYALEACALLRARITELTQELFDARQAIIKEGLARDAAERSLADLRQEVGRMGAAFPLTDSRRQACRLISQGMSPEQAISAAREQRGELGPE
jgi:hypothetical protein